MPLNIICDCCGETLSLGDKYLEFGDGSIWLKEHAEDLGEHYYQKYDDFVIKVVGEINEQGP